MNVMKIVSNCPLCEEKSLHIIEGKDNIGTQQCINCGYVSTDKFVGTKEDNETYKTLPEEMQSWAKEVDNRIWIPSMITLPFGVLYPINVKEVNPDALDHGIAVETDVMKWAFAEMVDIPEEEQKNYPDKNDNFYKKRYETDNRQVFDTFLEAMAKLNDKAKDEANNKSKAKLPKLKKMNG